MINRERIKRNHQLTNNVILSKNILNKHHGKIKSTVTKPNLLNQNHKSNSKKESDLYFTIISPMVGTFYRSPAPNEPHFIKLYDEVEINQTVCIIEAMKLMNEIEAEIKGSIIEILVKDGDIVDCGQALMKIKPN